MHRAARQRIDANLTNQRSRDVGEVIVGASRRSRERVGPIRRSRVLSQDFQGELPQCHVSKWGHALKFAVFLEARPGIVTLVLVETSRRGSQVTFDRAASCGFS
jgi:hypothetical protein